MGNYAWNILYSVILPAKSCARCCRPAAQTSPSQAVHRNLATGPNLFLIHTCYNTGKKTVLLLWGAAILESVHYVLRNTLSQSGHATPKLYGVQQCKSLTKVPLISDHSCVLHGYTLPSRKYGVNTLCICSFCLSHFSTTSRIATYGNDI